MTSKVIKSITRLPLGLIEKTLIFSVCLIIFDAKTIWLVFFEKLLIFDKNIEV